MKDDRANVDTFEGLYLQQFAGNQWFTICIIFTKGLHHFPKDFPCSSLPVLMDSQFVSFAWRDYIICPKGLHDFPEGLYLQQTKIESQVRFIDT